MTLPDYALKTDIASVYRVKGSLANLEAIQAVDTKKRGDVYNAEDTGMNYVWTGNEWDAIGSTIDLTDYVTNAKLQEALDNVESNNNSNKGKRPARVVIGTSTAGYTADDVDYLCDSINDQEEINQAINALPENGGEISILDGIYNITAPINITNRDNVRINGSGRATRLKRLWDSTVEEGVINITTSKYTAIVNVFIDGNKEAFNSDKNREIKADDMSSETLNTGEGGDFLSYRGGDKIVDFIKDEFGGYYPSEIAGVFSEEEPTVIRVGANHEEKSNSYTIRQGNYKFVGNGKGSSTLYINNKIFFSGIVILENLRLDPGSSINANKVIIKNCQIGGSSSNFSFEELEISDSLINNFDFYLYKSASIRKCEIEGKYISIYCRPSIAKGTKPTILVEDCKIKFFKSDSYGSGFRMNAGQTHNGTVVIRNNVIENNASSYSGGQYSTNTFLEFDGQWQKLDYIGNSVKIANGTAISLTNEIKNIRIEDNTFESLGGSYTASCVANTSGSLMFKNNTIKTTYAFYIGYNAKVIFIKNNIETRSVMIVGEPRGSTLLFDKNKITTYGLFSINTLESLYFYKYGLIVGLHNNILSLSSEVLRFSIRNDQIDSAQKRFFFSIKNNYIQNTDSSKSNILKFENMRQEQAMLKFSGNTLNGYYKNFSGFDVDPAWISENHFDDPEHPHVESFEDTPE